MAMTPCLHPNVHHVKNHVAGSQIAHECANYNNPGVKWALDGKGFPQGVVPSSAPAPAGLGRIEGVNLVAVEGWSGDFDGLRRIGHEVMAIEVTDAHPEGDGGTLVIETEGDAKVELSITVEQGARPGQLAIGYSTNVIEGELNDRDIEEVQYDLDVAAHRAARMAGWKPQESTVPDAWVRGDGVLTSTPDELSDTAYIAHMNQVHGHDVFSESDELDTDSEYAEALRERGFRQAWSADTDSPALIHLGTATYMNGSSSEDGVQTELFDDFDGGFKRSDFDTLDGYMDRVEQRYWSQVGRYDLEG